MKFKKKEIIIASISFFVGLVAHFFIISNPLFNADGIFYNRSMGAGSILGRWLIEILNSISKYVGYVAVIPMLNIVISLAIIAFSSIYFIRILNIKNDILKALVSISLLLSPSLVQTFFYGFTSHVYALSILLTILSVYYIIEKDKLIAGIIFSTLAIALYQAYIPFMLCMYLCVFISMIIEKDLIYTIKEIIKSIVSVILSLILYFMLNSIINNKYNGYIFHIHGMSDYLIPEFKPSDIIPDIVKTYTATWDMFLKHNVFAHNTTQFIRIIYLLIIIMGILSFVFFLYNFIVKKSYYASEKKEAIKKALLVVVLFVLFPIAINFMFIMTNNGIRYTDDRLSYSYVFYIIVPILLINLTADMKLSKNCRFIYKIMEKVAIILTSIILIHNIWLAYGSYYNQYKIINASKSFAVELATNIKMLPDYHSDIEVLFVGSPYEKNTHFNYGYYVDAEHNLYSNFDMEYENILSEYPMKQVFKEFTAFDFKEPVGDLADNLMYSRAVKDMPIYPASGSVKIIDDIVVVKFRELKS